MPASAADVFGASSATSIFSAKLTGGASNIQQAARVVTDATNREIKRIRGYKVQLTPADNKRLTEIQKEIQTINQKAADGTVRRDEIDDRAELYIESDFIIGKPSAGIENDDFLDDINEKIETLLAPKLTPQKEKRLAILNNMLEQLQDALGDDTSNVIAIKRVTNVQYQIDQIDVSRPVTALSVNEKQEYDELVDTANAYAGKKLLLNARDSARVQALEETIAQMASSLPASNSGQPTSADVSRAYGRLL